MQKGRPSSDHSLPLSSSRSDAIGPSYLSLHCSPRTIRTPADCPRPPRRLEWRCESRTPPCPIRASGPRGGLRRAPPLTCTARSRWRDRLPLLADGEGGDWKRVGCGQGVSVRVDLGGRRSLKKK